MNVKKYFPHLILSSALLISITGSFFSIYGLGKLFGGHQIGATILAFAFEFGNIVTASALKYYWKHLPLLLKVPLVIIVFILTMLTSMGIYGFLSDGYQKTALKDEMISKQTDLVKLKKETFIERLEENKKEIESINISVSELSKGYNQNTQTQQVIKGQVVTNVIVGNKKGLEAQLNVLNIRKYKLDSLNSNFLDSIQRLELKTIEIENSNEAASELGPLKYLEKLTGKPMNQIVNILIVLIVVVFQPLALMLILTSMFAFKNNHYLDRQPRKKSKIDVLTEVKNEDVKVPITDEIPKPKPKRKPREKKKENNVQPDEVVISESETKPRKLVDNNLTPDIADHILNSLKTKKKV